MLLLTTPYAIAVILYTSFLPLSGYRVLQNNQCTGTLDDTLGNM